MNFRDFYSSVRHETCHEFNSRPSVSGALLKRSEPGRCHGSREKDSDGGNRVSVSRASCQNRFRNSIEKLASRGRKRLGRSAREDGIGGSIENFWSTRFQSFPCESTINTIFQGGPFDCSIATALPPPLPLSVTKE